MSTEANTKPRIGISSCIIGHAVRFNGQHAATRVVQDLESCFEWLPVCPEVGAGLGIPRETVRLKGTLDAPRMVGTRSGDDHTEALRTYSRQWLESFAKNNPHGFILKKKSPSCGMERIPVYNEKNGVGGLRNGLFAEELQRAMPMLPVEEDGRLNDPTLRENFIVRVYAYQDWKNLLEKNPSAAELIELHTSYKLLLMAHERNLQVELGRLVASVTKDNLQQTLEEYGPLFMECLSKPATTGKNVHVLYRLLGFLKNRLSAGDKEELISYIRDYRENRVPLSAPLILFSHHFRNKPSHWYAIRKYLQPYPRRLTMRFAFS